MHRLRWDLRSQGEGRGGPVVPPGEYTVRLSAGDVTAETGLELRIDPRVAAEGVTVADLEEQYRFNLAVRETQAEAREVADGIDDLRERIAEARADAGGGRNETLDELAAELDELDARVSDAEGSYPRPMLLSQLNYLAGMTGRADQAPGADAYERHAELREEVQAVSEWLQALVRRLTAT